MHESQLTENCVYGCVCVMLVLVYSFVSKMQECKECEECEGAGEINAVASYPRELARTLLQIVVKL